MCGRFLMTMPVDELNRRFRLDIRLNLPPRYNIAPTQPVGIVRRGERSGREFAVVRWGLVPSWAKEISASPQINARAETVADKPFFRGAYRQKRCLVPANGWYEWTRGGDAKQPYALHLPEYAPLAFAGLWELWEGRGEGSWLESMAILTQPALGPAAAVHDRMPVLIGPGEGERWLYGDDGKPPPPMAFGQRLIDQIKLTKVSREVGKVSADGPNLLIPVSD
jgi:putative SOS response-associated peptidase YedK